MSTHTYRSGERRYKPQTVVGKSVTLLSRLAIRTAYTGAIVIPAETAWNVIRFKNPAGNHTHLGRLLNFACDASALAAHHAARKTREAMLAGTDALGYAAERGVDDTIATGKELAFDAEITARLFIDDVARAAKAARLMMMAKHKREQQTAYKRAAGQREYVR